jgi:AcrR family transcriptional regulator
MRRSSISPAPARPAAPGSPAWWSQRGHDANGKRRGRPPRSLEQIIAVAGELLDDVGADAFTMRALAARLNTSTATLYRHFQGKDELMVYVVDRFLGAVPSRAAHRPPRTWQDIARARVMRLHEALSQHPNVVPLLTAEVPIGPHGLAVREATISELVRFGFSAELAARAYTTLAHYVVGFAAQQHAPGAPGPRRAAQLRDYYLSLDPERFPSTVAAADALTTIPLEIEFAEGLQFILSGIECALAAGGELASGP